MENIMTSFMNSFSLQQVGVKLFWLLLSLLFLFLIVHFLRKLITDKVSDKKVRYRLQKWVAFFLDLLFILLLLSTFKKNMSNFTVVLGVIGASMAGWPMTIGLSFLYVTLLIINYVVQQELISIYESSKR